MKPIIKRLLHLHERSEARPKDVRKIKKDIKKIKKGGEE